MQVNVIYGRAMKEYNSRIFQKEMDSYDEIRPKVLILNIHIDGGWIVRECDKNLNIPSTSLLSPQFFFGIIVLTLVWRHPDGDLNARPRIQEPCDLIPTACGLPFTTWGKDALLPDDKTSFVLSKLLHISLSPLAVLLSSTAALLLFFLPALLKRVLIFACCSMESGFRDNEVLGMNN